MGDLLSASSLLLAVIGILYGLWYADLIDAKNKEIPPHSANCTAPKIAVSGILWSRAMPLATSSIIFALVFMPDVVRLVSDSYYVYLKQGFSWSRYDSVGTAFCVVVAFKMCFAVHLSMLFLRINVIRRQLKEKEDV